MAIHQFKEAFAMTIDAEGIGEGKGYLAATGTHRGGRRQEGLFGRFAVPQVALQVENFRLGHQIQVQVPGVQAHGSPQIGAHRALGIRGDQNQAAGGGGATGRCGGVKAGTHRSNVVGENRPQLVIAHPADEGRLAAQLGNAGQGVGGGTTGGFQSRAQAGVKPFGRNLIDQGHGALAQAMFLKEAVVGLDQHVHDGVADADHIKIPVKRQQAVGGREAGGAHGGRREWKG